MKRLSLFFFLVLLISLSALPGQAAPLPQLTPTANVPVTGLVAWEKDDDWQFSVGPEDFPAGVNPLTGLLVDDPDLLNRRPLVIKITNHPRYVRPQAGLSLADVVYEYYLESGISRFVGVFYGQDAARAGPVRSGRFFDEHLFTMYDGIFAFGYADVLVMEHFYDLGPDVYLRFVLEGVDDSFHDCSSSGSYALCRDRNLQTYNNLFADTSQMGPLAIHRGTHNDVPDLSGMHFEAAAPTGGLPAQELYVRYSLIIYGRWIYSAAEGRYLREQEDTGYTDARRESYDELYDKLTRERVGAENVVVLFVNHHFYKKTDTTEILQIDLVNSGAAYVFRDGQAYPAVWVRPPDGGVLNLFTLDGEPFPLKPGQTWYQVYSQYSDFSQSGAEWRFSFNPPPSPAEPIVPGER